MPRLLLPLTLSLLVCLETQAGAAEKAYLSYPQAARDKYQEGERLREQGQHLQAIAAYEEAVRLGLTDYPRVHLRLAECHRLNKNYPQSIVLNTRFLEDFGLERSCLF
jgi:tetratricopeptide (TPR) repeat protein